MMRIRGYLRLMRPANIVTAIADVLAGIAIAGSVAILYFGRITEKKIPLSELLVQNSSFSPFIPIFLLMISTSCLYGGGVVLNDVFDADLDKVERPERPIPGGLIKKSSAAIFGTLLLLLGILTAALANHEENISASAIIASAIAIAAVAYDKWMKHHGFFGPLTMGFCRGCNLLLGMSIETAALQYYWFIALVPVIYIFAITMISRGEVHGGKRTTLYIAAILYSIVILAILIVSYYMSSVLATLPFVALFGLMIFIPLRKAINNPEGPRIGKAVKNGVISLIIMNAAWAAAFNDLFFALIILLLLPVSLLLARMFAVT